MAKIYVSWNDVEKFVSEVAGMPCEFTGVYGIARGGLIPAVMISHRLHIPMLMSPVEGCLIVDDICDSGESLVHYVKDTSGGKEHNYVIATMFYKPNELGIEPDLYMAMKYDDWIVFPWENKED